MKRKSSKVLSCLLAFFVLFTQISFTFPEKVQAASSTLKVYPAPSGVTLNSTYTVKVRIPGGEWEDLDEYQTTIGSPTKSNASFVYFDTEGQVEVEATYNAGTIESARVRGLNKSFTPTITGNTMNFTISGPTKLSVEVNGDVNRNIMIFANPLEVNPPSPGDPDVIYLGPGIYQRDYDVPSGKTLYIAGGAVIRGAINLDSTTNAKVIGRGVLDRPTGRGISADYANQVTIDGIIVNNYGSLDQGGCALNLGNATNATVNNFKAFSANKWGDAIDTFAAKNVKINDVFLRSHDDCIAIYNARANGGKIWYGDTKNIEVTNSILMPDLARPINIGTHGFPWAPGGGHSIEDISFFNLDIWIHNQGQRIQFISADGNLIQNVRFNDIRIEDHVENRFLVMSVKNWDYGAGRGINNVYFKNVSYTGNYTGENPLEGQSATRRIQNITFENLEVNGSVITNGAQGKFNTNAYVDNLKFIAAGEPVPEVVTQFPKATPINLALNRTASASGSQGGNAALNGNDGSTSTRWCADNGNNGHWWMVDLGTSKNITNGTQIMWGEGGVPYQYKIETSNDNVNWTVQVDKTANTNTDQIQNDDFYDTARYVKITVTGLPSGGSAGFYDFKVLGEAYNLAEYGTASADSAQADNPPSNGKDGNATTLWSANDGNTGHWWTVELDSSRNITYGTQVSWEKSDQYRYKIETSNDNTNWTLKVDKTDNTSTDQVQTDYFTDTARYVRITVTGMPSGSNASFYDFKVFGDSTNLALGKPASADSLQPSNPASKGNDESIATRWSAADGNTGHWWTVDIGSKNITGTQVMWEKVGVAYQYKIETSTDNVNWTLKVDKTGNTNTDQVQTDFFMSTARYVRITVTGLPSGATASFYDFKVLGGSNPPDSPVVTAVGGSATYMGSNSTMKMITYPTTAAIWRVTDIDGNPTALASIDSATGILMAGSNEGTVKVVAEYSEGTASKVIKIDNTELKTADNTNPEIIYTQGSSASAWVTNSGDGRYGGSDTYIQPEAAGPYVTDVSAEYTFTGTGVQWIGMLSSDEAKADVYIDGIKMTTVDLYNDIPVLQHINYSIEGLDYGAHTIKLVNTGTKNTAQTSSNYNLSVDAFKYLDPAVKSVTLYIDKTTLGYGNTAIITPALFLSTGDMYDISEGTITYTNTNPAVASVDTNGVVKAKNAGTTNIAAIVTKDGAEISSNTVTITVTPATAIVTEADAGVQSWKNEKQRNYGAGTIVSGAVAGFMRIQYASKLDAADFNTWMYHPADPAYDAQTDATDLKISYLRFDLSGMDRSKAIKNVELKVSSNVDLSSKKIKVLAVDDVTWKEGAQTGSSDADAVPNDGSRGINFFNRPQLGNTLVVGNGGKVNEFSALDITDYIKNSAENKISLALASDSSNGTAGYVIYSREAENAAYRPHLLITYYTAQEAVNAVASNITGITTPEKDATSLSMPEVPEGYSIAVKSVAPEGIIGTDGSITPPVESTTVAVVFTVKDNTDGYTADTASIAVTVPAGTAKANANLSGISIDGNLLKNFEPETTDYTVMLRYGTSEVPVVEGTAADTNANVSVTQSESVTGSAIIVVTAADGSTAKTYTVKFKVADNADATLAGITVNGTGIKNFEPETTYYTVTLRYGTSEVPTVEGTAADTNANVSVKQAESVTGSAVIVVTAADGSTARTYTVKFEVEKYINGGNTGGNTDSNTGGNNNAGIGHAVPVMTSDSNRIMAAVTVQSNVYSNGRASAAVNIRQFADALKQVLDEAAKQGSAKSTVVEIRIDAPADARSVETILPKVAVESAAGSKISALKVSTPIAAITLDGKSIDTISKKAADDVRITVSKVGISVLPEELKQIVGGRPVFDFSIRSGDTTISRFDGGVTVTVPYTLKDGEDADSIIIYNIGYNGKAEVIVNSSYNPDTGTITFKTNYFSAFAVGYNKIGFKDVEAGKWYRKAVEFIAAREITTGTGDNNFSPDARLTRGQFIVQLMLAYDISPDIDNGDNFADAGNTYFSDYLAAAKRLGISDGVGNNLFAPGKEISRQEMFTLLYNVLKSIGELPAVTEEKDINTFSDADSIAAWAKEAITVLVGSGAVNGSGGKLLPGDTTSRAEMAQVLYNLLSK